MNLENYAIWEQQNVVSDMTEKSRELLDIAAKRRSIRLFSDRAVDLECVRNAIRIAATAPSGANCQPWKFVLVTSATAKKKLREKAEEVEYEFYQKKAPERWLKDLEPFGTDWEKPYLEEAPALILVFSHHGEAEHHLCP